MKARRKLDAGKLSVGFPSHRDESILNAGGNRTESVLYSFASDGGAIGTVSFGRKLPAGAIVTRVVTHEISAVLGATSVTVKAGSVALTGALDFTANAGIQSPALAGAVAGILISADSELNIAIASAAATAGSVRIYVSYVLPTDISL